MLQSVRSTSAPLAASLTSASTSALNASTVAASASPATTSSKAAAVSHVHARSCDSFIALLDWNIRFIPQDFCLTVPTVPVGQACAVDDVCSDVNARCVGGSCQCVGDFITIANQCGQCCTIFHMVFQLVIWL